MHITSKLCSIFTNVFTQTLALCILLGHPRIHLFFSTKLEKYIPHDTFVNLLLSSQTACKFIAFSIYVWFCILTWLTNRNVPSINTTYNVWKPIFDFEIIRYSSSFFLILPRNILPTLIYYTLANTMRFFICRVLFETLKRSAMFL